MFVKNILQIPCQSAITKDIFYIIPYPFALLLFASAKVQQKNDTCNTPYKKDREFFYIPYLPTNLTTDKTAKTHIQQPFLHTPQ